MAASLADDIKSAKHDDVEILRSAKSMIIKRRRNIS